ncbi:FtsK/SpoIIIE domain-containing protein, partial [Jatrophihabitans endophyticus]|uniref:FtsK/SpoIIIE domain-containing protein n=1 Tax=Jatrophihabitans endophyticus TaxID=1206085 RepID=UPI0019F2B6D6
ASDASVDRRVTGLAFADSVTRLPPWCARTVDLWRPVPGTVLDRIDAARAERAARALAPLRDAARGEVAPPDRCHLLDVLGLVEPSTDEILARWAASGGRADTVLGLTAAGSWTLDLERDGPHVLVAGTTGSGKSELLRTMVLGLALLHPPDELTFVLVDFKGGAAFADCSALPHAVGSVTDLDPHLTRRALHSLEAELRRRERALAAAGVSDLRGYRAAGGSGLARLVIVVDEFAALADTLPDFLHGLVSVARRGRSLGVHLVLATQRPGVAVTPEIRANTACRIALRVVEGSESTDVIGVPTAAELPARRPGRALGSTTGEPVEFQTATVDGAVRDRPGDVSVTRLGPWPRRTVTAPAGEPARGSSNLVDVARRAAVERGVPAGTGPWRAPLPERLAVDQLEATAPDRVPVALVDRPDDQRQDVLELDLREAGSWLLVGGSRSGRTTALLGLALTAAAALSPAELEIYVLDGGGPLAAALRDLPHVATCLGPDELSVAGTLARRLADRPPGRAHVLLLVDDGERVLTADAVGPPAPDGLAHLAAAVTGRRATVVVAGSRTLLSTRVAAGFDHRLLLALADRSDYALAGVPARAVPQHLPPGRAVRVGDGVELQFAVVGGSPDDPASTVRAIATRWGPAGRARDAVRLRPLPRAVRLSSLASPPPRLLRLGLGGESAQAVLLDPFAGSRRWWVAGPARSGRTTALLTLLDEAMRVGLPTVVVAAPQSAPARCAEASGARVLDPSETRTIDPPTAPTLVLVDDVDLLADSPLDDVLARWARGSDTLAFVVAGRSDVLPAAHRGLTAEIRRARSGILLRPGPLDGELFDVRLPPTGELPPGRGLLVATSGWSVGGEPTDGAAPVPVQVAQP